MTYGTASLLGLALLLSLPAQAEEGSLIGEAVKARPATAQTGPLKADEMQDIPVMTDPAPIRPVTPPPYSSELDAPERHHKAVTPEAPVIVTPSPEPLVRDLPPPATEPEADAPTITPAIPPAVSDAPPATEKDASGRDEPVEMEPPVHYPPPLSYDVPKDSPLPVVGDFVIHPVRGEETLYDIARLYGLGIIEVALANPGVDVWVPEQGREILVSRAFILPDAPKEGIVINLPELRLYHYQRAEGQDAPLRVTTYPIGAGREGLNTPIGLTSIQRMKENPIWYPTAEARRDNPEYPEKVLPGEDNPLGSHAMYLGWPTYIIHGTHKPWGVGRRVSRGCIRLYPEHVPVLYAASQIGTKVRTVIEPIKLGFLDGALYIEVHPRDADMEMLEEPVVLNAADKQKLEDRIDKLPGTENLIIDWSRVWAAVQNPRGYPLLIGQPRR